MKNFIIALAAGSLLALAATNGADAQSSNNFVSLEHNQKVFKFNKSVLPDNNGAALDENSINAKALKGFRKSYKNASEEKWGKNQYGLTARFAADGIDNTIFYDKKGNWEASLKNYGEDKFDRTIRGMVKSKYYDYKITQVQEVETTATNGIPTYMVHIEGDTDFKIIRVSDGDMDVYEEYAKQK